MSDIVQIGFEGDLFSGNGQEEYYIGFSTEAILSLEQRAIRINTHKVLISHSGIEIGREFTEARDEFHYKNGGFIKWVQKKTGFTEQHAYRLISAYEQFGKSNIMLDFWSDTALMLLSSPSVPQEARDKAIQRAEVGEKITVKIAKEIIDAQQAQKRAEEAAEQANAKTDATQQELLQLRSESHNAIIQLSQQIEDIQKQKDDRQKEISKLQQQIATISTQKKEIIEKEIIPPDAAAKIAQNEQLQARIAKLTEQRDNLSKYAKELGKDLDTLRDANEAKRARELQEARVLQNWRDVTGAFHKQVLKLLAQFPTPIDTQIFEGEDWERLSQAESIASRFLSECNNLSRRSNSMIIESR